MSEKSLDYTSLISAAFFSPRHLQDPNPWVGHLPFGAWLIEQLDPKIFVELGTHSGNSYFSFCQTVKEKNLSTKCYAIDTWEGDEHSGYYEEKIFQQVKEYNQNEYAEFSHLMRMTFDEAISYFADQSIDLLHIDGLHTYEAVKHDFENWLPRLSAGAVVLFHDTYVHEREFGVWKLWKELQTSYPLNLEFTHSYGLGILQVNGSANKSLQWLAADKAEQQIIKNYFSSLGVRQLERFELNSLKKLVRQRDEIIKSCNKQIIERDNVIKTYKQQVVERDEIISNFNKKLSDFDNEIIKRNGIELRLKQEIDKLTQDLSERSTQIADLNELITERDKKLQN